MSPLTYESQARSRTPAVPGEVVDDETRDDYLRIADSPDVRATSSMLRPDTWAAQEVVSSTCPGLLSCHTQFSFTEIQHEGRRFEFKWPILARRSVDRGVWGLEYAPLQISGYGGSAEEAKQDFVEDFVLLWDGIALEDDANLTGEAQLLKRLLTCYVRSHG